MPRTGNIAERNAGVVIRGVDLFCGAGGLTKGLEAAGIDMRVGVDIDPACEYPFSANNNATYLMKSVEDVCGADFAEAFEGAKFTLLAGCAPCQPFSRYQQGKTDPSDKRWNLLQHFARLVKETNPDLVTMENVPRLAQQGVFEEFVFDLRSEGFEVCYKVINCADYGVPHTPRRNLIKPHNPINEYPVTSVAQFVTATYMWEGFIWPMPPRPKGRHRWRRRKAGRPPSDSVRPSESR